MATVVTTNATYLTQPVNYVLMKGLLQAARKKLPYFNGTLPGELIKNGGSSAVKWERINNLTATTTHLIIFEMPMVDTSYPCFDVSGVRIHRHETGTQ